MNKEFLSLSLASILVEYFVTCPSLYLFGFCEKLLYRDIISYKYQLIKLISYVQ